MFIWEDVWGTEQVANTNYRFTSKAGEELCELFAHCYEEVTVFPRCLFLTLSYAKHFGILFTSALSSNLEYYVIESFN